MFLKILNNKVYEEFPDFDASFVQKRNNALGLGSGLNDRLIRITPNNMKYDFIWLNLLNGDFGTAKKLIDEPSGMPEMYLKALKTLYYSRIEDFKNASSMISTNNSFFGNGSRFFYAKLLLKRGRIEDAKNIFSILADGRFFAWQGGLYKKEAQEILSSL